MEHDAQRLDTWLWAARLFKTRALAAAAIGGGHVEVGGRRGKPATRVRPGDELEVVRGSQRIELEVRALSPRRGPASEAALLYAESADSIARRERERDLRRMAPPPGADGGPRPTKRDRRRREAARHRRR